MPGVENKNVFVTGGNRGIGLAAAKLMASRGANVVIASRTGLANSKGRDESSEPSSDGTSSKGDHQPPPPVLKSVKADLSTKDGCANAVESAVDALGGPIDVLVCNHGIGSAHEVPLHLTPPESFANSVATNLDGPYHLTRAVMPTMVDRKYGRLVYTSSTAATEAEPAGVGYNTSKAGLLGLMRSAAQDGGIHNITANAVLPGWVRTEMAERSAEAEAKERGVTVDKVWEDRAALYPPRRVVTPEEVAHTILFLASEESSGVSGESIRVSLGCPW